MIVPKCEVRHRPNRNRIVDDDRALFHVSYSEDRDLWLVDDRHPEERSEHARVRNRKRPTGHFIRFELLTSRAACEVGHGAAEAKKIAAVGLLDHRHDQAPIKSNRYPE